MRRFTRFALALAAVCSLAALPALAAVPTVVGVTALVTGAAGGPVSDGDYAVSFSLFSDPTGGTAAWTEGPVQVSVKGGLLQWSLGSKTPLGTVLAGKTPPTWLEVQLLPDPALPRRPMLATPFALRAAVAEGLDCSGCVPAAALDPKALSDYAKTADLAKVATSGKFSDLTGGPDLTGYPKKTDLAAVATSGSYADLQNAPDLSAYAKVNALAKVAGSGQYADLAGKPDLTALSKIANLKDVAFTGAYGDLTGQPVVPKVGVACGTGLVVAGIKNDGSLDCVAGALTAKNLPPDGLDEVSNNQLTTQFTESVASTKTPIDIQDGIAAGLADAINVPDFGIATALTFSIDLTNSDISKVRVTLYDPNGVAYKLYDQNGTGTALKATYPNPDKMVSGDLTPWIGKNVAGQWSINVADLSGTAGKTDGKLNSWSVNVATLSSKKVAANGLLLANGGLKLQNANSNPVTCAPAYAGYLYLNTAKNAIYVCNGTDWFALSVDTTYGTINSPALSCKDMLAKIPSSKDGAYYLDPDGPGNNAPFQAYCDMTTQGGGWTLVASTKIPFNSGDTTWGVSGPYQDLQTLKATSNNMTICNRISFSQLSSFRFSCFTNSSQTSYGIDWIFPLASGSNSSLMSDIYDDGKIGVYGNGKLTQDNGKVRLIGYDNGTSKADWGLGSEGGDAHYWDHEAWGQVDTWGGHCQDPGTGHTTATLSGTGIYHIWVR